MKTNPFEIEARAPDSQARTGKLHLAHGCVHTPAFMPVGSQGTVKTLTVRDLKACGVEMILANVYHLSLRPGVEAIRLGGGLHRWMAWDGGILTDSGGYQVFSLSEKAKVKVEEDGVAFSSPLDGSMHHLTPEGVVEFQLAIGSDVVIPLDQCVPYPCGYHEARQAVERTTRWALRSKKRYEWEHSSALIFGVVQGATHLDLRRQASDALIAIGFHGYAIGGFSVGEPKGLMFELLPQVTDGLPSDRPRYLMGMGEPTDVVEAVCMGVDLFDCVIPTRHGRNGLAYTWHGPLHLTRAAFAWDPKPVDPDCSCEVCRTYSRMYLRHLFQSREMLAMRLLSFHNVWFYSTLMSQIRQAIAQGTLGQLSQRLKQSYASSTMEETWK
jgi:queuine tRNA-ribosyltransferase